MNWLIDFLQGFAGDGAVSRGKRRGRLERVRHYLKRRRARTKAAWKKLSKRIRRIMLAVLAIAAIGFAGVCAYAVFFRAKPKASVDAIVPTPAAPNLPEFDEKVLATDP